MSAEIYSVPGQTEGKRKTFLEWISIDLSSKLSLTCGGNFFYCKSVHHLISTRGNRERPCNFFSFQLSVQVFSLHGQTEGERKVIRDEKASPFVKFEIILPLFCFFKPPYK